MPDRRSAAIPNAYFAGDLVRTRHGSWSQEKALVTGLQAASAAAAKLPKVAGATAGRVSEAGLAPLDVEKTEPHVALARRANRELFRPPILALRKLLPVPPGVNRL